MKAAGVGGVAGSRYGSSSDSGRKHERTSSTCVSFPARRPRACGMEPVTCDCVIFDKFNLDSNFSVAAFEEWGWLVLLSVSFTSGNNKQHLTG